MATYIIEQLCRKFGLLHLRANFAINILRITKSRKSPTFPLKFKIFLKTCILIEPVSVRELGGSVEDEEVIHCPTLRGQA